MDARKALDRLADALVEDILSMSDEEILAEFEEDHGDPERHVAEMRALVEKSIAIARERRMTSFLPEQQRKPAPPTEPPIVVNSNVRHRTPPPELADTMGKVSSTGPRENGRRPVWVSWEVEGKRRIPQQYDESELENVD